MPMKMMGIVTPIIAVAMILSEALFGAGNTKFVAAAQFCLVFFLLVPLAWVLGVTTNIGLTGMWVGAVAYAIGACHRDDAQVPRRRLEADQALTLAVMARERRRARRAERPGSSDLQGAP